ncbi:hypothetical protein FB45DRAFT_1058119 [Roridomyces roridus]|uniref:F-box domain-containing protein n=1 Tax=Roridomyces roridus TaxID=1738132 RepID=A0AAD7BXU4_9AGAR|nr:hypothetical protein FB45DRAFT_1058119 [Roridomyces roridus]
MASSFDWESTPAAARARLEQLDIEIAKLQRLMDPLLAEHERCQQALADYKYPVLTLPAEITSESPSFLLQICRQWRDVALTTPALWSTVALTVDSVDHIRQRRLLHAWLQRSGNCPLSIELASSVGLAGESDEDEETQILIEFVDSLACYATRWQDMEIILPCEGLRRITGSMPLLRSVNIGPFDWEERPETPFQSINDNTALVTNHDPHCGGSLLHEAVEVLRQTTTLEHCTLTIYDGDPSAAFLIPSLPLRSLTLSYVDAPSESAAARVPQLLAALNLPLLETLAVHELYLGLDPIAALSRVCPDRYPRQIEIFSAHTPREIYAAAFPLASLSVHESSV